MTSIKLLKILPTFMFVVFIQLPRSLGTIFYELELGVVIGQRGSNIAESEALEYVAGYFLALDMTAKEFIVNFNILYSI